MRKRPLLYLAAPYTRPDPVLNTHTAIRIADLIYAETNWVPVVPHLTMLWHAISPKPVDHWYEYDLHILRACDGILRLPGESTGADLEVKEAEAIGLRRVYLDEMPPEVIDAVDSW